MPAEAATDTARSETLALRVTPEERRKIKRLSRIRDRPYSELLREKGVEGLISEHDRIMEMTQSEESS